MRRSQFRQEIAISPDSAYAAAACQTNLRDAQVRFINQVRTAAPPAGRHGVIRAAFEGMLEFFAVFYGEGARRSSARALRQYDDWIARRLLEIDPTFETFEMVIDGLQACFHEQRVRLQSFVLDRSEEFGRLDSRTFYETLAQRAAGSASLLSSYEQQTEFDLHGDFITGWEEDVELNLRMHNNLHSLSPPSGQMSGPSGGGGG